MSTRVPDLCVISYSNDNRYTVVTLGRKGSQKEGKVAERKRDKQRTDSFQLGSPGHSVQGQLDPAGAQREP